MRRTSRAVESHESHVGPMCRVRRLWSGLPPKRGGRRMPTYLGYTWLCLFACALYACAWDSISPVPGLEAATHSNEHFAACELPCMHERASMHAPRWFLPLRWNGARLCGMDAAVGPARHAVARARAIVID